MDFRFSVSSVDLTEKDKSVYHSVFNCLLCTMVCTVYNIKPFVCHVYVCVLYSPSAVQVSCSYEPTSSGGHISKNALYSVPAGCMIMSQKYN